LLCCVATSAPSSAQPSPLALEIARERASIVNNGVEHNWTTDRFQVSWVEPEAGGWFAGIERAERDGRVDVTGLARGYKRAGVWTIQAAIAGTPDATFQYRASVEGELSRRLVGTVVASGGYRYMSFPAVDVQQAQPALAWYHSRGEVQGRVFFTWRDTGGPLSRAVLVQAVHDFNKRVRLRAGGSYGDRIFDVALLAGSASAARASIAFANVRIGVTSYDFVEVGGSIAHERPAFDYTSISVGYRRVF
jgi:YaiO family outer membrane protein